MLWCQACEVGSPESIFHCVFCNVGPDCDAALSTQFEADTLIILLVRVSEGQELGDCEVDVVASPPSTTAG